MRGMGAIVFLTAALSFTTATPAAACMVADELHQAFFGVRPAEVPPGLVVLKVQASEKVDEDAPIPVKVLESSDGAPAGATIFVKLESPSEFGCDVYDPGVLGQPAYIFGVYGHSDDGSVYFRALWLRRNYSSLRRQRPWTSYIVDPALRAKAEATGK